jgi:hypothetical protein
MRIRRAFRKFKENVEFEELKMGNKKKFLVEFFRGKLEKLCFAV